MIFPSSIHTVKPKISNLAKYNHLKPHEVLFNGMLYHHEDGRVSIAKTDPDRFSVYSGKQKLNWGCVMFKDAEPLFPYALPSPIKFGEDFWPWSIAWMLFLRKIHAFTGKTYPRGKAIDVGLIIAAGGMDRLQDFVSLCIDDRSRTVYLGVTYKKEIDNHLKQYQRKIKEMEEMVSRLKS